jgi:hypothetical protein
MTFRLSLLPGFEPQLGKISHQECTAFLLLVIQRLYTLITPKISGTDMVQWSSMAAYEAATTWIQHPIFKVVCAKPTPHFLIPAFYYAFEVI